MCFAGLVVRKLATQNWKRPQKNILEKRGSWYKTFCCTAFLLLFPGSWEIPFGKLILGHDCRCTMYIFAENWLWFQVSFKDSHVYVRLQFHWYWMHICCLYKWMLFRALDLPLLIIGHDCQKVFHRNEHSTKTSQRQSICICGQNP